MNIQEIEQYLVDEKENITKSVIARIQDKIVEGFDYSVKWEIEKQVKDQLLTLIADTIKEAIQDQKQAIVDGVKAASLGIGQKLAEHMIKNAAENLEGYNSNDVMKKLFGIY